MRVGFAGTAITGIFYQTMQFPPGAYSTGRLSRCFGYGDRIGCAWCFVRSGRAGSQQGFT